jgi:hypothetical protein
MRRREKAPPKTLTETLDRLGEAKAEGEDGWVTVDDMMEAIGRRSFGPLVLVGGVVMCAPGISDIPGVPTLTGIFVGLVAGQMVFGRDEFWLPGWLLKRSVSRETMQKFTKSKWTRKPAKLIDGFVTERLSFLVSHGANRAVAIACLLLAVACPFTELIPLSGPAVGIALLAFGISMVAHDGLMALLGFLFSAGAVALGLGVLR